MLSSPGGPFPDHPLRVGEGRAEDRDRPRVAEVVERWIAVSRTVRSWSATAAATVSKPGDRRGGRGPRGEPAVDPAGQSQQSVGTAGILDLPSARTA